MGDNIILEYPLRVYLDKSMETVLFARNGAEVFKDEHGIQWIKFISQNGSAAGKQHMLRTENVVIVKDN